MIKLRKKDIREILNITFPGYNGRKFKACVEKKYYIENAWSGGTCVYFQALRQVGTKIEKFNPGLSNPLDRKSEYGKEFTIPDDVLIVEHSYFCGHDLGIMFYYSPNSIWVDKLITEGE